MSRPVAITTQPLLPSKSEPSSRRRNSLETARQHLLVSCEQCREHGVASLQEAARKAKLKADEYRSRNTTLEVELQCSEEKREKLGQQLSTLRSAHESILQKNFDLREENEILSQNNALVFQGNLSLVDRLAKLEPELATLRKAAELLRREKAVMREEFSGRYKELTVQKVQLQNEVERLTSEKEESSPYMQKLNTVEERAKQLAEEVDSLQQEVDRLQQEVNRLQQELNGEKEKLTKTQQHNQSLQSELNKLQNSSHPCSKRKCMETRTERDQLARKLDKKCERPECLKVGAELRDTTMQLQQVLSRPCQRQTCMETTTERDQLARKLKKVSAELEDAKKKITQMKKKPCNSERCKNEQLKDMNDTIGFKIRIGDREISHSEALQHLVERQHPGRSEEVKSLQSDLQKMQVEKQELQEKLDAAIGRQDPGPSEEFKSLQSHLQRMQVEKQELQERLDSAIGSNAAGRCTRSDCQVMEEQLKRMQSKHIQGRSAAEDMSIMRGGEYDEPLEEFNEVFTNPDELLGILENCLESFEAKRMLCRIFKRAYDLCKSAALHRTRQTLEDLFTVSEDKSRKAAMGEISRAYGLLLHVTGLKNDTATCKEICCKIVTQLTSDKVPEAYNKAGRALQAEEECLLKCVQVAWKFVTLPSPIIASQPEKYNPQIVDREFGYWDESTPDATLIYTRPVVYRCYDGNCAEKGMVANAETCNKPEGQKKGFLQRAKDFFSWETEL